MASTSTPSIDPRQAAFERATALSLHLWADLAFAVENELGGADSADKRDWLAGSILELFPPARGNTSDRSDLDLQADLADDVEARLAQVMSDEFNAMLEDDSPLRLAEQIVRLWWECGRGEFGNVDALQTRWEGQRGKKVSGLFKAGPEEDQDTDWDDDDDDDDDDSEDGEGGGDEDAEMGDAPAPKAKPPPEVDEEGFTKVTRKKR